MPDNVILLTGFEPFGGEKVNPSILGCRELDGRRFNNCYVKVEEVPLRFEDMCRERTSCPSLTILS